jgi:GNAT superfamily N-acetyltransferase
VDVQDQFGVAVAECDAAGALDHDWASERGRVDVVRVVSPAPPTWEALEAAGFVRKPSLLTWAAPVGADRDAFLGRLRPTGRRSAVVASRRIDALGIQCRLRQPLEAGELDDFLALYERCVVEKRHALPAAVWHRDLMLEQPEHFAVYAYQGGALAGGCIAVECPGEDAVRLRFSAVEPAARWPGLARVLYLHAVDVAREKGYGWATLGNDPNLYGHLVEAGLFAFKCHMGFVPVPSQAFPPGAGYDEADLFVSLAALGNPTLVLGYIGADPRALRPELFSHSPATDTRPFRTRFLAAPRLHVVAEPAP